MKIAVQLASRIREILLCGEWVVATNYKKALSGLTWEQANKRVNSVNTIADLTFHIDYYIAGVTNVLEGGSLGIRDTYSFDAPVIKSQVEWESRKLKLFNDAERLAFLVEQIPDEKLEDIFADQKYGNYLRNINVLIEHSYYHLGQIVLIKKMILLDN